MSVSGSRAAAEINLDEFERRLRAAGAQEAGSEDPLSELARIVESSRVAPATAPPSARIVSGPGRTGGESEQPLEMGPMRPSIDDAHDNQSEAEAAGVDAPQAVGAGDFHASDPIQAGAARPRGAASWEFKASALALAGAAMIGAAFVLNSGMAGLPNATPLIA